VKGYHLIFHNVIDVVYGIGAITSKTSQFFSRYHVENTKITPSTRLDILLRNRK